MLSYVLLYAIFHVHDSPQVPFLCHPITVCKCNLTPDYDTCHMTAYVWGMHMDARVCFVSDSLSSSVSLILAKRQLPLQFSRSHSHGWPFVRLSGCMWRQMNETSHTHKTHTLSAHTHTLVNNPAGSTSVFLYRWIKKRLRYRETLIHTLVKMTWVSSWWQLIRHLCIATL